MKIEVAFRLLLTLLPVAAGGGCATSALWTAGRLDNFNQPAQEAHLRIFADDSHSDVVVVYDEYSERRDSTHTRAYRLSENESRIEQQQPPIFAKFDSYLNLKPVPVFVETNFSAPPPPFYAVLRTNAQSFTLCSSGHVSGPYALPVYDDGKGKMERIALTPLAATADATIVGGILGMIAVECLCESNTSIKGPKL